MGDSEGLVKIEMNYIKFFVKRVDGFWDYYLSFAIDSVPHQDWLLFLEALVALTLNRCPRGLILIVDWGPGHATLNR